MSPPGAGSPSVSGGPADRTVQRVYVWEALQRPQQ